MKPSQSAKDRPGAARGEPSRREGTRKPADYQYDLRVQFYARMRLQRVYSLVVAVPRSSPTAGPTGVPVVLRPVVPGALVTPVEQALDISRPGAAATFHVTPLGKGRLPDARVQVLCNGQLVQELATPMKATTQRMTWVLLLLTLVLPPLLIHYTRHPLEGKIRLPRAEPVQPQGPPGGNPPDAAPPVAPPGGGAPGDAASRIGIRPGAPIFAQANQPPQKPPRKPPQGGEPGGPPMGGPVMPAPPEGPPPPMPTETTVAGGPDDILEDRLNTYLRANVPSMPGWNWIRDKGCYGLGQVYKVLCDLAIDVYPGFLLGCILLGLTLLSWVLHSGQRSSLKRSVVIPVGTGAAAGQSAETLPLARPAEPPITAEPAE
jgi:hypothetical protein